MNEFKAPPNTSAVSTAVLIAAIALIIGGVIYYFSAPPELPRGSEGWFESVSAANDVELTGTGMIGLGIFGLFVSFALSMRLRRAQLAWSREDMQAVGEGLAAGFGTDPKQRLHRLEALRRDGTVSDEEYRRKRADIVAQL
jgi:hypothetical protein